MISIFTTLGSGAGLFFVKQIFLVLGQLDLGLLLFILGVFYRRACFP